MIPAGSADATLVAEALRVGADDSLLKPCKLPEIWMRVENCLGRSKVRAIGCAVRMT